MNRNAEDKNAVAPCSNATLEGRFLFTEAGFEPKEDKLVPYALTGYQDNANGTADGVATYIVDGEFNPPESYSGTYSVNADCTSTATYADGTRYDQFIGSGWLYVNVCPDQALRVCDVGF